MIMSPAIIIARNRLRLFRQNNGIYSFDGLDHIKDSKNHIEDCIKFLVTDVVSVTLIADGFRVEYSDDETGYLLLDESRFKSVCDNDSRQSEQRLLCAYLNYLSGF